MKRSKIKVYALALCLCIFTSMFQRREEFQLHAQVQKPEFDIQAQSAILINADTMEVLYGKNENAKMFPASTTKILSAMVASEKLKPDQKITAPANYKNPDPEGSNIAIDQNEVLTVEQLLNATLVASANDAVDILAMSLDTQQSSFIDQMNRRAHELGARDTHFVNPHGLHDPEHYTTAYDLALIAAEMMNNPVLKEMVAKTDYIIPPTNKKKEERNYLKTTNWFLRDNGNTMVYNGQTIPVKDENVIGIKTGFTDEAGYCLVSEIVKDNRRFIVVVLNSPSRLQSYIDSKHLLYYGLENFQFQNIVSEDETVTTVTLPQFNHITLPLVSSHRIAKSMPLDYDKEKLRVDIKMFDVDSKNIERDTVLGSAAYYYEDALLGEVDLLASHSVSETDFIGELTTAFSSKSDFNFIIKIVAIPLLKLFIAYVIWWIIVSNYRRFKRRRRRM